MVALLVDLDEQDLQPGLGERGGDGCGQDALTDPALAVDDDDDLAVVDAVARQLQPSSSAALTRLRSTTASLTVRRVTDITSCCFPDVM
ncbi:hypothetical protein [Streptomyces echinatus]|uniref:hypothetical protein n=1 Tax=Streptomyces echinatus TaxID=67293 RepID=UPI0037B74F0D